MAEEETIVSPFNAEENVPGQTYKRYPRSPNLLWDKEIKNRIKNKIKNSLKPNDEYETFVPLEEVLTPQQMEEERQKKRELNELPDINVPEVETHVEDLPKEDVNEKELIVEHPKKQEEVNAPSEEELSEGAEQVSQPQEELPNELDKTQAEQILGEKIKEPPKDEGGDKTLTPDEKQNADMNEMRALAQDDLEGFKYDTNMDKWTPKQKQDAIKAWRESQKAKEEEIPQEPPEDEKPKMTKEEALAEARMLAQDDLEGVDIDPNLWSQFDTKEKMKFVEMLQNKDKEQVTNVDEDTTNNYEAYKRYPTALRGMEDVLKGADNIANRAATDARKNLAGGEGVNGAVARSTIPHYDYRSFFK